MQGFISLDNSEKNRVYLVQFATAMNEGYDPNFTMSNYDHIIIILYGLKLTAHES